MVVGAEWSDGELWSTLSSDVESAVEMVLTSDLPVDEQVSWASRIVRALVFRKAQDDALPVQLTDWLSNLESNLVTDPSPRIAAALLADEEHDDGVAAQPIPKEESEDGDETGGDEDDAVGDAAGDAVS